MGAYRAWMVSALCPQIKSCSSYLLDEWHATSYDWWQKNPEQGRVSLFMLIPNLRNYLDYAHVYILWPIPNHACFQRNGNCFRWKVWRTATAPCTVWKSQKVDNRLTYQNIFDCGHHFGIPMQEKPPPSLTAGWNKHSISSKIKQILRRTDSPAVYYDKKLLSFHFKSTFPFLTRFHPSLPKQYLFYIIIRSNHSNCLPKAARWVRAAPSPMSCIRHSSRSFHWILSPIGSGRICFPKDCNR